MPKRRSYVSKFIIILILFLVIALGYYFYKKRPEKSLRKIIYRDYVNVMSYDINHGVGIDDNYSIVRIIKALRQKASDLIFLFDVDYKLGRSFYDDQARIIAANLGMEFTFGRLIKYNDGWNGFAIFTKYPIEFSELQVNKEGNIITSGILHTITRIGDIKIHSYGIYFLGDSSSFHRDFTKFIDLIMKRGVDSHVIVSACFRNPPNDKIMNDMSYYFYNMSSGMTDSTNNLLTINSKDFIYINDHFDPIEFLVIKDSIAQEASNNLPLYAKIKVKLK